MLLLGVFAIFTDFLVLLDRGVRPKQICIITPDDKPGKSCFNNRDVDLKVFSYLFIN